MAGGIRRSLRGRVVAMPNYVSAEILRATPQAIREPYVLAVGRLAGVKNYDTLLAAWALIAASSSLPANCTTSTTFSGHSTRSTAPSAGIDSVASRCRRVTTSLGTSAALVPCSTTTGSSTRSTSADGATA